MRQMYIYNLEQYKDFIEEFSYLDTIDTKIFDNENFRKLVINPTPISRTPQYRVVFETESGEHCQMTETQAVQFLMTYIGNEFEKAEAGRTSWQRFFDAVGCSDFKIPERPLGSNGRNFYKMIQHFWPENNELSLIKDNFFKRVVRSTSGWVDDSRNFFNSKCAEKIVYFDKFRIYEQVSDKGRTYTDKELDAINKQYYEEEKNARGNIMGTAVDREIVAENAARRLLEDTGYKYLRTEYDIDNSWTDENAVEMAKLLVPDFWEQLEEVTIMIIPGTSSGVSNLKFEETNPLCYTRQYVKSVERGFSNFCELFHVTDMDRTMGSNKRLSEDEFLVNQFSAAITAINLLRNVCMAPKQESDLAIELTSYYYARKRTIERLYVGLENRADAPWLNES